MDFETSWSLYEKKVNKKMKSKKRLRLALVSTLLFCVIITAGAFASNFLFQKDNTEYAFTLDEDLVGTWETVDLVDKIVDFNTSSNSITLGVNLANSNLPLKMLAFTTEGNILSSLNNEPLAPTGLTFTKGHIVHKFNQTDSAYEIKTLNGNNYLFMQDKGDDYIFDFKEPKYYVLKRVDQVDHKDTQPVQLRKDNIQFDFVNDTSLLGKWKSVACVLNKEDFPNDSSSQYLLSLDALDFHEWGNLSTFYYNGNRKINNFKWTNGKIIDPEFSIVENYFIEEINGKEYLFFPWISGDVIYRNSAPAYYVLERVE